MKLYLIPCFLILALGCTAQTRPLRNAHAHNDYEHERPLLEALENGFTSVEVDVHLVDGELYIVHDPPNTTEGLKTLEELYLKTLKERVSSNNGKVYKGYNDFFYLMIDVKTPSETSYPVLRRQLEAYQEMISVVENGSDQKVKPIKVFISGFHGRPFDEILNDSIQYAGIDGRPEELSMNISSVLMPVISQNYNQYLSWNGEGEPDRKEVYKLVRMINEAHKQDKKVRLWALPDIPVVWDYLLGLGIDLINTDKLYEFNQYMKNRH